MNPKKIMLIDDSDIDNYINKAIILKTDKDIEIVTMTSAKEALVYLKDVRKKPEYHPDVIFLDIRMPEMDGFEFMEEFKKLPKDLRDNCNVYILSSSLDPVDANKSKQFKEIKKHLTKPLAHHPIDELLQD